jgi:hypothetical protein
MDFKMDLKTEALEYVKIYFSVHPDELPREAKAALKKMKQLQKDFKNQLIAGEHKASEDFFNH